MNRDRHYRQPLSHHHRHLFGDSHGPFRRMRIECGKCGWWIEIPDSDNPFQQEGEAIERYSLHQLEVHPHTATHDSVVRLYVQSVAHWAAPTNGALTHKL